MIEITSFLLKHLYELMADDYNARHSSSNGSWQSNGNERARISSGEQVDEDGDDNDEDDDDDVEDKDETSEAADSIRPSSLEILQSRLRQLEGQQRIGRVSREQETNQQIVSFLANNHLPDLICETFIELLFICVFLAVSWIFVMIVQLHCHQAQQSARIFYCNTKFLSSLMYCNHKPQLAGR